jgi:hypothetical protein
MLFDGGRVACCGRLSQVDPMGVGIGLHFRMLWHLSVYFTLAAVIAAPCFAMAYWGGR